MTLIPVENTREIVGSNFLAVQAGTDADAETMLTLIAQRRGVTVEKVYLWGPGYYYAPIDETKGQSK